MADAENNCAKCDLYDKKLGICIPTQYSIDWFAKDAVPCVKDGSLEESVIGSKTNKLCLITA
ncbi:MAG: hypothetical protein M1503_11575 [Thaumarchaeota archaeon]|nr:hypothetical protein [Nitrososphaerota archaeon]MCL5318883.1 hypothetical protein [Nitrososphaerota archaeon]